jgi:tetratricopeptide (TPR) repeat protein
MALAAIMAGIFLVFQHVSGSGHATADMFRRVLGATTTARIEAAYRGLLDGAHSVQDRFGGGRPTEPRTLAAALTATTRDSRGAIGLPTAVATVVTASGAGLPATPIGIGAAPITATPTVTVKIAPPPLAPVLRRLPASRVLQNDYQVYETWNNCGPASLSMALSYFGIHESQAVLGEVLRPYQNQQGDNDDKDVTTDELANEARTFGLLAYHRPDGNIHLLKEFIASGLPVIAETVMTKDDDIGHYRVVKGYDDTAKVIIQDDSMQGHNVQFSYSDFDYMWKKYNYEYLVLVPRGKQQLVKEILGKNINPLTAWRETVTMDRASLAASPSDIDSRFNLSVALYYTGEYQQSVNEFEKVQYQLPFRTLWYQMEPIEAYFKLGDYQRVFALANAIVNNGDRAYSQLYIVLGRIYQKEGNIAAARAEFELAAFYNVHLKAARDALRSVS